MATSSGAPTPTSAATSSTSPDKKKLFAGLGIAGVAVLGLGGYFLLNSSGGSDEVADASATNAAVAPVDGAPAPGAAGAPGSTLANGGIAPATATQISTTGNPSTLLPLSPYRRDPFQPFVVLPPPPTPAPPPLPTPTPEPPPVSIPQPEPFAVPSPGGGGFGGGNSGGGGFGGGGSGGGGFGGGLIGGGSGGDATSGFAVPGPGGTNTAPRPLILPEVVIPRLNSARSAPTNTFPPPRSSSGGGGSGVVSPSFDKRLSGVVIGNGVRAILEISGGVTPKTYVVQPGDVVEGITILNIRRYNEGGTQVTRMLIRENGAERTVDLKPGPPREATDTAQGAGGFGGP